MPSTSAPEVDTWIREACGSSRWSARSDDHIRMHLFAELEVVAVVHRDIDQYRSRHIHGLSQCWRELIRRFDGETLRTEGLRIFDSVDRAEIAARGAAVLRTFLEGDHVVVTIAPDHVHEVTLESYRGFQFLAREQKAAVAGDRNYLVPRTRQTGGDCPWEPDAQRLLTVGDHHLPRPETVEIAQMPDMDGTHVERERRVIAEERLQVADDAQGVDRRAFLGSALGPNLFQFAADGLQQWAPGEPRLR